MFEWIARVARAICRNRSGNATMLVAMGIPALIGSAGLAIDVSQWYVWKRELQYAVDQAAIAGAYARSDSATQSTYLARAQQEFEANLSITSDIAATPQITLANYNGGVGNSVAVSVTASDRLPFSSFLTGSGVTIAVSAQASFTAGGSYTSCIIATDPTAVGAITIGGSSILLAKCGIAALSTSEQSIVVNGNPDIDAGWVISKGGISDWFEANTDDTIMEHMDGLYDPFASLTPPTNPTSRSYGCTAGSTTTYGDVTTYQTITTKTYTGSSKNSLSLASTTTNGPNLTGQQTSVVVPNGTSNGYVSTTTSTSSTGAVRQSDGSYKQVDTSTSTEVTYTNIQAVVTPTQANLLPGTYSGGFKISCTTVFSPGIYVIDGGGIDLDGQYQVTGTGVMFVIKSGAYVKINGGTNMSLTSMTAEQLKGTQVSTTSISDAQAQLLDGMLIFEDPNSQGSSKTTFNGNNSTVLNGTVYFPVSAITFSGTATVTSRCLMIAARLLTIGGSANMSTFCPAGMVETTDVASQAAIVKLVV